MTETAADIARERAEQARAEQNFNDTMQGIGMEIADATRAGQNSTICMLGESSRPHLARIIEVLQANEADFQVKSEERRGRIFLTVSWPEHD